MSNSAVSITANHSAASRRRLDAVIGDIKQNIDIATGISNRDLSYSMEGERVVERPSNFSIRSKNRKSNPQPKSAKRRWYKNLTILTKNVLLILVLVGLVQMVRRLVISSGKGSRSGSLMGLSDLESRISKVESSLKTTSKMLLVQVEVVDKKIDSLVGDLRIELNRKIEENNVQIGTNLRKLGERSETMEISLDELKSKDFLTKNDLARLYDELKKAKGSGDTNIALTRLDEIRVITKEIVEKEIEKHAADGLGRVDYALASAGAMVVKHSEPFVVGILGSWFSVINPQGVHNDADKLLKPSFGEPGQCFPLKGSRGFVQIRLRTAIVPEAVTLEHVAKNVGYDRSSAPKRCRVSGWLQGWKVAENMFLLTEFTYELENKTNAQTFNVFDSATSAVIDTVRFEFDSNHGCSSYTCIYRLRVHGHEPNSLPMVQFDSK